jgi:hypothetical protein
MATPVVVSRIQNRRGTQAQFDSLYTSYPGVGPNVLQPGEIALCTDSHRIFIGNLNGTYDELGTATSNDIILEPLIKQLAPAASFTIIPELTILPTAFFTYLYSITDSVSLDAGSIGVTFSRNGEMKIASVVNFVPVPPLTPVAMTDESVEINRTAFDIVFQAEYNSTQTGIEIQYKHDFPGNLNLCISSIQWVVL